MGSMSRSTEVRFRFELLRQVVGEARKPLSHPANVAPKPGDGLLVILVVKLGDVVREALEKPQLGEQRLRLAKSEVAGGFARLFTSGERGVVENLAHPAEGCSFPESGKVEEKGGTQALAPLPVFRARCPPSALDRCGWWWRRLGLDGRLQGGSLGLRGGLGRGWSDAR